jgi:probable rRNA maturation factor
MEKNLTLSINNKTKGYKIIPKRLSEFFQNLIKLLNLKKDVELSIAFVGSKTISSINDKFRNINKPTNVISFNLGKENIAAHQILTGEIIICPHIAEFEARRDSNNFQDYIEFLLIHGFLHILGYDHNTAEERKTMESLEEKIFKEAKNKKFIFKEVYKQ